MFWCNGRRTLVSPLSRRANYAYFLTYSAGLVFTMGWRLDVSREELAHVPPRLPCLFACESDGEGTDTYEFLMPKDPESPYFVEPGLVPPGTRRPSGWLEKYPLKWVRAVWAKAWKEYDVALASLLRRIQSLLSDLSMFMTPQNLRVAMCMPGAQAVHQLFLPQTFLLSDDARPGQESLSETDIQTLDLSPRSFLKRLIALQEECMIEMMYARTALPTANAKASGTTQDTGKSDSDKSVKGKSESEKPPKSKAGSKPTARRKSYPAGKALDKASHDKALADFPSGGGAGLCLHHMTHAGCKYEQGDTRCSFEHKILDADKLKKISPGVHKSSRRSGVAGYLLTGLSRAR